MSHALVITETRQQATAFLSEAPDIARRVIGYVLDNFAEEVRLEDLADAAGMTRFNFCRRFHKDCGMPPIRWLWAFRVILAHEFIMLDPRWSLTDVAFACGFTSSAHFSRSFKAEFKVSPSKFRREQMLKSGRRDEARSREQAASLESLYSSESETLNAAMRRSLTLVVDSVASV